MFRLGAVLQELNDRDRFLQVLLEKYQQASAAAQAGAEQQQQQPGALLAAAAATAGGSSKPTQGAGLPVNAVSSGPPLLLEEAVAVIIRNERGRQVSVCGVLIALFLWQCSEAAVMKAACAGGMLVNQLAQCAGLQRPSSSCSDCSTLPTHQQWLCQTSKRA